MASFHLRANNIGVEIIIILLIIYFTWKEKGFLTSLTKDWMDNSWNDIY